MSENFSAEVQAAISHLEKEFSALRTGRATPAMIEDLPVEAYGAITPLQQLAAISSPEPRLLVVQPWDPSVLQAIEKALQQSSFGVMPVVDGKILRLPLPAMTEERRKQLLKVVSEKAEEAKVRIRGHREEAMKHLKRQQTDGDISEDAAKVDMAKVQKAVEESHERIDALVEAKTQEIMTV